MHPHLLVFWHHQMAVLTTHCMGPGKRMKFTTQRDMKFYAEYREGAAVYMLRHVGAVLKLGQGQ